GNASIRDLQLPLLYGSGMSTVRGRALFATASARGASNPFAAAELRTDGSILAADGLLLDDGKIPSVEYEKKLTSAVAAYLSIMRQLGVRGSVFATFGMHCMHGSVMATGAARQRSSVYLYPDNSITPDPTVFASEPTVSSLPAVASQLRPAFDFVWRE